MFTQLFRQIRHWFTPHHSNNFRARILHNSGFFAVIGIFFTLNILVRMLDSTSLHILGFTSSITIEEVVRLTNNERLAAGLSPLKYNEVLADAARRKAANMLEENYWAHNSPSGKSPWVWFTAAGYKYTHAGENLAKDFGSSDRMLSAWMASPTHRDNIVSSKFQEIGIAVVPGVLQGQETVLVVQLFGSTAGGSVPITSPQVAAVETKIAEAPQGETQGQSKIAPIATPAVLATPAPTEVPAPAEVMELKEFAAPPASLTSRNMLNEFDLKRTASLATTILLILVLIVDAIFAESNRLSRRVGKNWAHIIFINVILILVTIVNAGNII